MAAELDIEARDRLLDALADGCNKSEAARRSGYSRMHVTRKLKEKDFLVLLERRRADRATAAEAAAASIEAADERLALDTLRELAEEAEAEIVRVTAAKALLAHATAKKKARPVAVTPQGASPEPLRIAPPDDTAAAEWLAQA